MKRSLVNLALLAASLVTANGLNAAGNGTLPAFAKIKPSHSQLCLNSMDKRIESGVTIVQWSCSDQDTQIFSFTLNPDGFYSIQSKGSGLCFGVPYAWQGKVGVTLYQVPCPLYDRQSNEFSINEQSGGLYTISPARAPQTCLGVTYSSTDMFAGVVQETCGNHPNQLFEFSPQQ